MKNVPPAIIEWFEKRPLARETLRIIYRCHKKGIREIIPYRIARIRGIIRGEQRLASFATRTANSIEKVLLKLAGEGNSPFRGNPILNYEKCDEGGRRKLIFRVRDEELLKACYEAINTWQHQQLTKSATEIFKILENGLGGTVISFRIHVTLRSQEGRLEEIDLSESDDRIIDRAIEKEYSGRRRGRNR